MKEKFTCVPLIAALSLTGCAGFHKNTATGIVVATDRYADDLADEWAQKTTEHIAECRETLPYDAKPAERFECLEPYTPEKTRALIAAVQSLVTVQLAVKAAAECEELRACVEDTDWKELASEAAKAWQGLKPYVELVKGGE